MDPISYLVATATTTPNVTVDSWPVIHQLAWVFGKLMEGIFWCLSSINIYSVTICIIVFTIITKMILLPLTIKQQKQSKITSYMTPELQALQKKYEGRRDQASMSRMQVEQQQIYDKYGSSMTAGCLPALIQFPILFAIYPVIYKFAEYVPQFAECTAEQQQQVFSLFGLNLLEAPGWRLSWALIIPILAGLTSFLSSKLTMAMTKGDKGKNPAAGSMNAMMYMVPAMSLFFCISFPMFIGVYWIVQSIVMCIQQYIINKNLSKKPIEDLIAENVARTNKKRAKKGLPPLNDKATINTRQVDSAKSSMSDQQREDQIKASTQYYQNRGNAAPGSLAAKANMVKEFNERHEKKD